MLQISAHSSGKRRSQENEYESLASQQFSHALAQVAIAERANLPRYNMSKRLQCGFQNAYTPTLDKEIPLVYISIKSRASMHFADT